MRLMKRLTKRQARIILQSLPILSVAIVLVLYLPSFLPLTAERMERSSVLVEQTWYFAIRADGKNIAFVRDTACLDRLDGVSLTVVDGVKNRVLTAGCFVDRYPFFPSCRGRVLTVKPQDKAFRTSTVGGTSAQRFVKSLAEKAEELRARLQRQAEELDYYLKIHSVSDAGYNTMAELSVETARRRAFADTLVSVFKSAGGRRVEIRPVITYTVVYKDRRGRTRRVACSPISRDNAEGLCMLQTKDATTPDGAVVSDFHPWFTLKPAAADSIAVPVFPGCHTDGFNAANAAPRIFRGCMRDARRHDLPRQIAVDGAPVYSSTGCLKGLTMNGKIITPDAFGFGFNNILP